MHPHVLKNATLKDVQAADYSTAVLPIGATEPHNYHLPYGSDNFHAEHVAVEASRHANEKGGRCICLPPLNYGYDGNMKDFPLAISLQPTTIIRVVRDIALSVAGSGLDYLFIVNGHGGNDLKTVIRELDRDVDLFICGTNWWESVADVRAEVCPEPGDHAHAEETSMNLYINPELVKMDQAGDGAMNEPLIEEFKEGWIKFSRPWKSFAPTSGAGDPRSATREAGERLVQTAAERIGEFLYKLSTTPRQPGFPYAK